MREWEIESLLVSLDFFVPDYTFYDSLTTRIFHPHKVMIGVFERQVPQ